MSGPRFSKTLTKDERVVWDGTPCFASFLPRYLSATALLVLCIAWGSPPTWYPLIRQGPLSKQTTLDLLPDTLPYSGAMVGLFISGLVVIRLVHYNNGLLHGRLMISWMVITIASPIMYYSLTHSGADISLIQNGPVDPPMDFFIQSGAFFWAASVASTWVYQRSFRYTLTDRRVHLNHRMLYLWSNIHTIDLTKVENVIVENSLVGRVLGYGNLHLLTSSGIGIQSETTSLGIGASAKTMGRRSVPSRLASGIIVLLMRKRTRKKVLPDPKVCLFGISSPTKLHPVINDTIDKIVEARNAF